MADYISREAAIAVIYGQHIGGKEACENARPNTYGADLREIVADIEDIPAADVVERKRGKWMINSDGYYPFCSACHNEPSGRDMTDFCPHCGADMRGGQAHD